MLTGSNHSTVTIFVLIIHRLITLQVTLNTNDNRYIGDNRYNDNRYNDNRNRLIDVSFLSSACENRAYTGHNELVQ